MITIENLKNYLGIDYDDSVIISNLERSLKTANAFLKGAIGSDYPVDDPRAEELTLIVASELYDNRGLMLNNGVSNIVRRMVDDLGLQLRLELCNKDNTSND